MTEQPSQTDSSPLSMDHPDWHKYLQSQKWRKEPEITNKRKLHLEECRKRADPKTGNTHLAVRD